MINVGQEYKLKNMQMIKVNIKNSTLLTIKRIFKQLEDE